MPPHCDSLDGPVVKAAMRGLDRGNVDLVLPFVKVDDEDEIRAAFARSMAARAAGPEAREVADLYFFETTVRVHRRGENAPYTGLKPAGLEVGPVIPVAEGAIESGDPGGLVRLLSDVVFDEVKRRLDRVLALRPPPGRVCLRSESTSRPCWGCRCGPTWSSRRSRAIRMLRAECTRTESRRWRPRGPAHRGPTSSLPRPPTLLAISGGPERSPGPIQVARC